MKSVVFVCFVLLFRSFVDAALTEKQIQAASKLMKNTCVSKTKVTEAQLDKIRTFDWENVARPAMCFLSCIVASQKLFTDDNQVDIEAAEKVAKQNLPEPRRSKVLDGVYKCQNSIKTANDKCVAAFEFSKCFISLHPDIFEIP